MSRLAIDSPISSQFTATLRLPSRVRVVEVGPRDGLQNESSVVPTAAKARFVEMLADAGFAEIEVSSFVNPRKVPQLADAEELFALLKPGRSVRYSALVPNQRGLERALASGVRAIAFFTAASETFTQRNIGMTVAESLSVFRSLMPAARDHGLHVRAYISTAFVCPFEGDISPDSVAPIADSLRDMGVQEISLGDTIGHAVPTQVAALLAHLERSFPDPAFLACHFHDTRGFALANVLTALLSGITVFDSSAGGLGGCPFAPGASGNLATELLLRFLLGMGIDTGVDPERVAAAAAYLRPFLGPEARSTRAY